MNLIILTVRSTPWYEACEYAPYKYACSERLTVLPGRHYVQSKLSSLHICKITGGVSVWQFLCCRLWWCCGDLPQAMDFQPAPSELIYDSWKWCKLVLLSVTQANCIRHLTLLKSPLILKTWTSFWKSDLRELNTQSAKQYPQNKLHTAKLSLRTAY